jgi:hypothetical protein
MRKGAFSLLLFALSAFSHAADGPLSTYLVTPCRFVDTRDDLTRKLYEQPFLWGPFKGLRFYFYTIQGECGVPFGAKGVILNVTTTAATVEGHLVLWAPRTPVVVPATSNLNFSPGRTVANMAIVKLIPLSGPGYTDLVVSPRTPQAPTEQARGFVHVIIDVVGYLQ